MIIRKMEESDIDSVYEIIQRNFDGIMSEYHSKDVVDKFKNNNNADSLRTQMQWKDIFVVEDENSVIATGALANFGSCDSPKFSISNFYIVPEHHQSGIGRKLFNHLLILAKSKNIDVLHVPSSRNAIGFYEKMGFIADDIQNDLEDEITWMTMSLRIR